MVIDFDRRDLVRRHRNVSAGAALVFLGGLVGNLLDEVVLSTVILLVMVVVYLQHVLSDQAELRRHDLDVD